MGISRGAIKLLGDTVPRSARTGAVITFGVQAVQATFDEAATMAAACGADRDAQRLDELRRLPAGPKGRVHQDTLFRLLGYDSVESIDFYPAEGPTHVLDLNHPVPAALRGRYDLVYDGGTMEHCFAASEVLCNVLRLLKVGGRVIHHVPLNNWVDHGFYQFSPTLFFDFYEANGFTELALALHFSEGGKESQIVYDPRGDGNLPYSIGGKAQVLAFFTAVRAAATEKIVFPIQGRYRRAFGGERSTATKVVRGLARLKHSILKRTYKLRARAI